jgi:hypothetical protein
MYNLPTCICSIKIQTSLYRISGMEMGDFFSNNFIKEVTESEN